jgi:hypothetical protein
MCSAKAGAALRVFLPLGLHFFRARAAPAEKKSSDSINPDCCAMGWATIANAMDVETWRSSELKTFADGRRVSALHCLSPMNP